MSFLNYDLGALTRLYAQEPKLSIGQPYTYLCLWSVRERSQAPMTIRGTLEQFRLAFDQPGVWRDVVERAFTALENAGHDLKRNEQLVRVVTFNEGTNTLWVQPAEYNDQRRSNLILDYKVAGLPTLREMLITEYGARFPPLADSRLANTLGIAMMVLVRHAGRLCAYCVRRPATGVAVFQDTWNCTASGAAKWTAGPEDDIYECLVKDMLAELEEEVGLTEHDLTFLSPVGLAREVVRGGKPELLFLAGSRLIASELKDRRRKAARMARRLNQPLEVAADTLLQSAAWFVDLQGDPAAFHGADVAHQATGLLQIAARQRADIESLV